MARMAQTYLFSLVANRRGFGDVSTDLADDGCHSESFSLVHDDSEWQRVGLVFPASMKGRCGELRCGEASLDKRLRLGDAGPVVLV